MKKFVKLAISAMLVFTLSLAPSATLAPAETKLVPVQEKAVSVQEAKPTEKFSEQEEIQPNEIVTLDEKTVEAFQGETETIYQPQSESITVMEDSSAYVNDALSIFFCDGVSEDEREAVVSSIDGEIVGEVEFVNQYEVKIPRSDIEEINSICDTLMENECVEFASCTLANEFKPDYIPNDPWGDYSDWSDTANDSYFQKNNWWIKAVDADKAWDYQEKFSEIKIGIIDSGFDTAHEELQGKFTFPKKKFERQNAPDDHGTHVAGIIAAERDNGKGISGIVRDCQLVCVDWNANPDQGQYWISETKIMNGFINAVRAGAKVINFSLGSSGDILNGTTDRYKFVKDIDAKRTSYIMAKLLQKGYDFICCQSAGNGTELDDGSFFAVDASNNGRFCTVTKENAVNFVIGVTPQDIFERIIIVASAKYEGNNTYSQSYFSNGGSQVSICAPGSSIYSTYYAEGYVNEYAYLSGTSMATPIVTGIASLVWSVNQSFTGAQVKHFVCDIENTKYMVADSDDERHLPEGAIPMVNAQLAVEAALRANGDSGIVDGEIDNPTDPTDEDINVELVNDESGEVYRILTEEGGKFTAELPEGDYTMRRIGELELDEKFSVVKGERTTLDAYSTGNLQPSLTAITQIVADKLTDVL